MLTKISEELYLQLKDEIRRIEEEETDPFKNLSAVLGAVRLALKKLRDHITANPFKDENEQICFFKHIKPKFYCLRIFYLERYAILTNIPNSDAETLVLFYREELDAVQRFFQRISFHYQYYRLGATELDNLYFMRGTKVQSVLVPEMPEFDPEFATAQDYLFSKIKAYERLRKYILAEIDKLSYQPLSVETPAKEEDTAKLTWTGDKTNLVEVIYGLFYTGQINNGNANVADIIKWMEQHLNIDLHRAYRNFLDIRNRKRDSHTRYLDKMRASIQQRVDEDNRYVPNRGIKLRDTAERAAERGPEK